MRFLLLNLGAVGLFAFGLCGCSKAPGRPVPGEMPVVPGEISDFSTLYEQNCAVVTARRERVEQPSLSPIPCT